MISSDDDNEHTCLKFLDVNYCTSVTDEGLKAIARSCTDLEILNLSGCNKISGYGIAYIARSCNKLKELNIKKCTKIDDSAILEIAWSSQSLEYFNVSYCTKISNRSIAAIAYYYKNNLKLLNVVGCKDISKTMMKTAQNYCHRVKSDGLKIIFDKY